MMNGIFDSTGSDTGCLIGSNVGMALASGGGVGLAWDRGILFSAQPPTAKVIGMLKRSSR
jgi:hypothetical protein